MAGTGKYGYDFSDKVILVVEDTLLSYKLMDAVLKQVQAQVVHASDGLKALQEIESGRPFDLVLMDMHMPQMDGLEATRRIKSMRPDLPVVATTANTYDENAEACKAAGCDAFLTKPLQFRAMFELMQDLFDRKK